MIHNRPNDSFCQGAQKELFMWQLFTERVPVVERRKTEALWRKELLSGTKHAREVGRHTTKGGYRALDNICDTVDTLAIGVLQRLCDGRAHPYSARHRNHCAGGRPHSEAKVLVRAGDP